MEFFRIFGLTCEHVCHPLGVDTPEPALSWKTEGNFQPQMYRILAAADGYCLDDAEAWDSGVLPLPKTPYVRYHGRTLKSRERIYWKVGLSDGETWRWSEPTWLETGILEPDGWQGRWIGCGIEPEEFYSEYYEKETFPRHPAPYFRKDFYLEQRPESARLYICGLGFYEARLNGGRIGNYMMTPGFTQYDQTALYDVHDVTAQLRQGKNTIGVLLGNGMFSDHIRDTWGFQSASWVGTPRLLLNLVVRLPDGTEQCIATGTDWKTSFGPVVYNELRSGQWEDTRYRMEGWSVPGFDDTGWDQARLAFPPGGSLRATQAPYEQVIRDLEPVSKTVISPTITVYDMGENTSGWCKISVSGEPGSLVEIRYGERLYSDGRVDQEHIGKFMETGFFQTDRYLLEENGTEVWEPQFVYHGFQYVQVEVLHGSVRFHQVTGRVVHTAFSKTGSFHCSHPALNQIQQMSERSLLTNYHAFPNDCPHREKNGWTGDGLLSVVPTLLNFDSYNAHRKWIGDILRTQRGSGQIACIAPTNGWGYDWGSGPAWDSALILIPWILYLYTGDDSVLSEAYSGMKKYMAFLDTMARDHILSHGLGDWNPPFGLNHEYLCPLEVTDTAFYFADYAVMSKAASLLDCPEDAQRFAAKAEDIKAAYCRRFLTPTGEMTSECQTAPACTLFFGLAEKSQQRTLVNQLLRCIQKDKNRINTGILGAWFVPEVLSRTGYTDLALELVAGKAFPGWGWWAAQGATTLWGNWDGKSSRNHHMFSTVSSWLYHNLGGIRPQQAQPGFRRFWLQPRPCAGVASVCCNHETPYGRIESSWKDKDGIFTWEITVPPGTEADVILPYPGACRINETPVQTEEGAILLQQGRYSLVLQEEQADGGKG